jgi:diguanylate cyclase (GGDEF)-like protein
MEYYPVIFMEPATAENRAAIGFDISTDFSLNVAMARAAGSGEAAASARITEFGSDEAATNLFLFLVPVYARTRPVDTEDERREALAGFVFGLVSPRDLLLPLEAAAPTLSYELFDSPEAGPATLMHASPPVAGARYESADSVPVGGRAWLLETSGGGREVLLAPAAREVLISGLVLSVLLFIVSRAQVRGWETATRHEAELRALAQRDSLTKLPNRSLLDEQLSKAVAMADRRGNRVGVLFVDIDHFKRINDSMGHSIGDRVLQSVAARLVASVRASDTVSRLGGDEFVLLLTAVERPSDVAAKAQTIVGSLAMPHNVERHTVYTTASVGVSIFPDHGEDASALIKAADAAMYQAKEQGRNRYCVYGTRVAPEAVQGTS